MRWAVGFGGAGRAGPGRSGGDAPPPASSTPLLAHWPPHGGMAGVGQASPPHLRQTTQPKAVARIISQDSG